MDHGDFKDFPRRTSSDKVLCIAENSLFDGCQRGFASMVYNFFD